MPHQISLAESVRPDLFGDQPVDSEREPDLEDLVRLASELCDVPMSLVTLVDSDRRSYRESVGTGSHAPPQDMPPGAMEDNSLETVKLHQLDMVCAQALQRRITRS